MSTRRVRRRIAAVAAIFVMLVGSLSFLAAPALASNQTITGANLFTDLDGSIQDDDGTPNGVFRVDGDLTLDLGATITYNDNTTDCPKSGGNFSACPIEISVGGDLLMQPGSKIQAENNTTGGDGGAITITVGGDMTMCGQTAGQTGCVAPAGNPGALISAQKTAGAGDTGVGGDITITVGDIDANPPTGNFYMEGGSTGYGTETGAKIDATGPGQSGDITITAGRTFTTEPGAVIESGSHNPSAIAQGGKIYIVTGCNLTTAGRISSKGTDPGADLVHLEGCDVFIYGLVESTGKGHTVNNDFDPITNPNPAAPGPPYNSCDNNDDSLPNEVIHTDKTYNATGCIEVWGGNVVIDATGGRAGELNADIGNGGAEGQSWIDIYAFASLSVTDGTGNDKERNNNGHDYFSVYAVHANTIDGSDTTPNTVTAMVAGGPLSAGGKTFESSASLNNATGHGTTDEFVGNGSTGGTIDLEALGDVTLDTAWVNASGDFVGGAPCPSGSGACGDGGHIIVSAWDTGSNLSWLSGVGDVRPNDDGGTTTGGTIALNACGAIDTGTAGTATDFRGETPTETTDCGAPPIPGYVVFDTNLWGR